MRNKITLALMIVLLITSLTMARGQRRGKNPDRQPPEPPVTQELTEQETSNLLFMREEEKLARDVYTTLYEEWQIQIFSNIARAEQRHMTAVAFLITKYELTDPVTDNTVGSFTNENLADLYTQLIETGKTDLLSALNVGALIEEKDIFDLNKALAETDKPDFIRVYTNLLRGSRNHLRAFARLIKAQDATYTVDGNYLTQEEFDEIANSPMERGNRQANRGNRGRGNGNGRGRHRGDGHGGRGDGNGQGRYRGGHGGRGNGGNQEGNGNYRGGHGNRG